MKQIKIRDEEFNFPETWKEITLKQLLEYYRLETNGSTGLTSNLINSTRILEILCGVKENKFGKYKVNEVIPLFEDVATLVNTKPNFKSPGIFIMKGKRYGFINLNEITMDEMAAIDIFQRQYEKKLDQIPYIIAICCRPLDINGVIEDFDQKSLEERKEDILNHSCLETLNFANFFLIGKKISQKNSRAYTQRKSKAAAK